MDRQGKNTGMARERFHPAFHFAVNSNPLFVRGLVGDIPPDIPRPPYGHRVLILAPGGSQGLLHNRPELHRDGRMRWREVSCAFSVA